MSASDMMMSPDHLSSFSEYSRTASSPRFRISASISVTTCWAAAVLLSGVLQAFFRYSTDMIHTPLIA